MRAALLRTLPAAGLRTLPAAGLRTLPAAGLVVLLATGTAHADRFPVLTLGTTMDLRFAAHSWDVAEKKQTPDPYFGMQATLSFEDAPLPLTPMGKVAAEGRLVPELIAGELNNDKLAEGYIGAGLRAEIHMAGPKARAGFYIAGRGYIIGAHRDSAAEFAFGDYLMVRGMTRIGVEGGVMVRPQDRDDDHDLDVTMRLYVGWKI